MLTLINLSVIIAGILLISVVLLQNPKTAGVSSGLSLPKRLIGVKKTGDLVERTTWVLAAIVLIFCLSANFSV
jgi:preprotein translocase subunit SecG